MEPRKVLKRTTTTMANYCDNETEQVEFEVPETLSAKRNLKKQKC